MNRYIDGMEDQRSSEQALRTAVMVAAERLPQEQMVKAITSVHGRCTECSEVQGARFEYRV